jgi:hypothetical protein
MAAKRASHGRRAFAAVHGCAVGKPPNRLKREGIREADKTGRAFLWLLSCRHKKVTRLSWPFLCIPALTALVHPCTSRSGGRNKLLLLQSVHLGRCSRRGSNSLHPCRSPALRTSAGEIKVTRLSCGAAGGMYSRAKHNRERNSSTKKESSPRLELNTAKIQVI